MFKLINYIKILCLVLISTTNICYAQKYRSINPNTAKITIKIEDSKQGDTVRLMTYDNIYSLQSQELSQPHDEFLAIQKQDGVFVFNIPVKEKFLYFSIYKENVLKNIEPYINILREYIIEAHDDIKIDIVRDREYDPNAHLINKIPEIESAPYLKYIKAFSINFSGQGNSKYKLRYLFDKTRDGNFQTFKTDSTGKLLTNPAITAGYGILKEYANKVDPLVYNILRADFISEIDGQQLRILSNYKRYDLITQYFEHKQQSYSDEVIYYSRFYPFFLIFKKNIEFPIPVGGKSLSDGAYYSIKEAYRPGAARDKLLSIYVTRHVGRLKDSVLKDAIKTVKTAPYHDLIKDISEQITPGKTAFNFELLNTNGNKVKLSDFEGKIVFVDFWFTGCSACKGYYGTILSKVEERFNSNSNIVFITISIDRKFDDWLKSVNSEEYTSSKAINLFTNGKGQFDPVIAKYGVAGYPRPILIDRNGRIITDKQTDLVSNGPDYLLAILHKALAL